MEEGSEGFMEYVVLAEPGRMAGIGIAGEEDGEERQEHQIFNR